MTDTVVRPKPRQLDPITIDYLEKAIKEWATLQNCFHAVGVHETTFRRWWTMGREDVEACRDSIYAQLCQRLRKAQYEKLERRLKMIEAHGVKDHKALTWLVEREHRAEYGAQGDIIEKIEAKISNLEQLLMSKTSDVTIDETILEQDKTIAE
jgi:hypothetical protein